MDVDKIEEQLGRVEEKLSPWLDKAVDAIEPHVGKIADRIDDAFWSLIEGYRKGKEEAKDDGSVS